MIRLIASDLDETLLDANRNLPKRFDALVTALSSRGILFVVATARTYKNLLSRDDFYKYRNVFAFITSNGGEAWHDGKRVYKTSMESEDVLYIVEKARQVEGITIVLSCSDGSVIESEDADFLNFLLNYTKTYTYYDNVMEAVGKHDIKQVSIFDPLGSHTHCLPLLSPYLEPRYTLVSSGFPWTNVTLPHVDKGLGIREIQKLFGIGRDDTMVFGDDTNDISMFLESGKSYAVSGAHDEVVKASTNRCEGHEGVIDAVCGELDIML